MDKEKVFVFLDSLRESAKINMFSAAPYIQQMFGCGHAEAREMLFEWMETYSQRKQNH
jgi:hypothetical protein